MTPDASVLLGSSFFCRCNVCFLVATLAAIGSPVHAVETQQDPEALFSGHVLPLLEQRCFRCHSHAARKSKGELMLDSRSAMLRGGKSGPALVPGKPTESLLLKAVSYLDDDLQMPPKEPLSPKQVETLRRWIAAGAPDPRGGTPAPEVDSYGPVSADELWSFQPVEDPPPPAVQDTEWPRTAIDRFILSRLETLELRPLDDAKPRTLLRRAFLDLIGLPPTIEEQRAFAEAARRDPRSALRSTVESLLDSKQFGERWARHWLDTARFAESNGNNRNRVFRHAWRYRNWVIDACNSDKPYDRFLMEQLAGDLMPSSTPEERRKRRIATGFLAIGPKPYYPTIVPFDDEEPDRARYDWAAEQIDAAMVGMMGLTVGCARCHDHKFDPIPTRDYYALAGIFRSTEPRFGMFYHLFGVAEGQAQRDFLYDWNLLVLNDEILDEIKPLQDKYYPLAKEENNLSRRIAHLPRQIATLEGRLSGGRVERSEDGAKLLSTIAEKRKEIARCEERLVEVRRLKERMRDGFQFQVDQAMGVEDAGQPRDVNLRVNGEHARKGAVIPRGFLSQLDFEGAPRSVNRRQSGRLELARWIAHPRNPLTARVAVNRVWYRLFGRGLVNTLDNFGSRGDEPTHPELLDHLAHLFVHQFAWSGKRLIRYIVLSRTYGLTSAESDASTAHFEHDPDNEYYWRTRPRRLDAEAIRDSMLKVAGRLDLNRPEGSILVDFKYHADIHRDDLPRALKVVESDIRTVYVPTLRGHRHRLYDLFDYPDDETVNSARTISTVPTQGLYLLNNSTVMGYAESVAAQIRSNSALSDDRARIEHLYELCYGRPAGADEIQSDLDFLRDSGGSGEGGWVSLAHSFLISAEFLYRL